MLFHTFAAFAPACRFLWQSLPPVAFSCVRGVIITRDDVNFFLCLAWSVFIVIKRLLCQASVAPTRRLIHVPPCRLGCQSHGGHYGILSMSPACEDARAQPLADAAVMLIVKSLSCPFLPCQLFCPCVSPLFCPSLVIHKKSESRPCLRGGTRIALLVR